MLPMYRDIEEPLVDEIRRRGGSTRPSDRRNGRTVYEALAEHFRLSPEGLGQTTHEKGKPRSKWENMVRYARRSLVHKHILDNSQHGVWQIR